MSTQLAAPRRTGGPLRLGRRGIGLAPLAWIAIALYVAFLIYPIIQSVITSFTDRNPLKPASSFVGFANYLELFQDQRLLRSLGFTLVVVVFVTIVANAFGLMFAMLLNRSTLNYRAMRTLVFIPQVLSGVIVAFIWRSILTQNGLLNVTLQNLGLTDAAVSWIGTPELATLSICVVVSWMTIAFSTVVYTASLQSVPAELYEAARVDGAGAFSRFRNVTFPMIAPGVTISVTLGLITTLKLYDVIAVLTGGGPANSTKSVAFYLIDVAFTSNRFGYASAIAIFLLGLTAVIAYGTTGLLRRREAHL
ncbi:sugar ABC transporter permease [Agromyces protaetiae]|uniref:Sugar ABC transporter permease n=1 Tax=Agromyces protaetiae TaxID=2509455 RepID=A0A4P6FE47_9MICO|nr:sugar ABC transporter permease [Agromyces protaetiae]QAY72669.1 sugar ABC transporter permease [Agromyces protaetiae]